jgi:DNA-binding MarR family transcriptional regulator
MFYGRNTRLRKEIEYAQVALEPQVLTWRECRRSYMTDEKEFPQEQVDDVRRVVAQASSVLQAAYESMASGCIDMPLGDKRVLTLVAARQDIILRDIREALGMPNSTLTSAADRLEQRGLLKRVISQRDRRSYGLELTPGGHAYIALQDKAEQEFALRILQILDTDEERRSFVDILSKVVSRLE